MTRLVRILIVVALVLLALFAAPMLIGEKGYILIAFGLYTIELTLVSFTAILLAAALVGFVLLRLVRIGTTTARKAGGWFSSSKSKKRKLAFFDGLYALALGNKELAEKKLQQAEGKGFHGFNYVALGQLALQNNDMDSALAWFDKAEKSSDSQGQKTANLLVAQHHLRAGQPQQALSTIDKMADQQDPDTIKLRARAMADANEWQSLETALPQWKKTLGDDFALYSERFATHKFAEIASKQGANQLKTHWQQLPRKQRNDDGARFAYLQQLIHQGMHQDAQEAIVGWYGKKAIPTRVLTLIKQLRLKQASPLIKLLEKAIKLDDENADYYAALGHIAYYSEDKALSEKALLKAISLQESKQELALLADLYEQANAYERALQTLRRIHGLQH